MSGYYYHQNKNGITYYYSYKDKISKQSKRKKIYSCKEHNNTNLKYAIDITEEVLKENTIKTLLNENNNNINEELSIDHFTLNEIQAIYAEKYYNRKYRELKEHYAGMSEEDFNNDSTIKKKLNQIKRYQLSYNKNVSQSSIGKMKYKDITKRKVSNWLETELNQNISTKTKYTIIAFLRATINSMKRNDYIVKDNVFEKINIQNDRRQRTRVLSPEELELLLKECKKYNKSRVETIYRKDTGTSYERVISPNYAIYTSVYLAVITAARAGTILTIKKKDIDLKNGTITLINHKANNRIYKIPLNESAIKWFEKKLKFYEDNDYLLQPRTNYRKKVIGKNNALTFIPRQVYEIMNELFNKGIDRNINLERDNMVNFHTLRRSIATNLALSGVSIYKIKKLLDHSTIDITEKYLNLGHLDYKENLNIFHNELFKNFENLLNHKEEKSINNEENISNLKEKLIKSILLMSGNENNEVLELSLRTLNEKELKYKLTKYV